MIRPTVVNFCSTAVEMLDFSTEMLLQYAGTGDFDYLVVTWNPSDAVERWLSKRPGIFRHHYQTRPMDYVPNLRCMMSEGFDAGYRLNDWVCIVNTDMAFGVDWLVNLMRRAENEDQIPNSVHITPVEGPHVVTENLGVPTRDTFHHQGFWRTYHKLFNNAKAQAVELGRDMVDTPQDRGGDWRSCATMPYLLHRKWWERYGPWESEVGPHSEPPDRRFFGRCADGGAKFFICLDSICYHHEAVERRGSARPIGAEKMRAGV